MHVIKFESFIYKCQCEAGINTLDPGSGQIAVEEGRDGLAGLGDLVVVVVTKTY